MKAEGGIVGQYRSLGVKTFEQDGRKHYMLCSGCDGFLGAAEDYVRLLMHGTEGERQSRGLAEDGDWLYGVEVQFIERFLLGVALKAHWAAGAPYHKISFGPAFLDSVQQHIVRGSSDLRLRIAAMRFHSEVAPGIDQRAIAFVDWMPSFRPPLFAVTAAGWEWLLFFDDGAAFELLPMHGSHLVSSGTMRVPRGDITQHRGLDPVHNPLR